MQTLRQFQFGWEDGSYDTSTGVSSNSEYIIQTTTITIITTIILTLFSSLSFADGHTSGKFNASGMGAWEVNVMNAGKGDMAVTYDGIAGLADETPDSIFINQQCIVLVD